MLYTSLSRRREGVLRRLLLLLCILVLLGLVTARSFLPAAEEAQTAMAVHYGYNLLNLDLPLTTETAGSALIAEMNRYYLFRTPTAKNECTGLAEGKNLILICAENWCPELAARSGDPAAYSLWKDGAEFTNVYRPDWYQGMDGREFALLTGVIPTNVDNNTALLHTGEQHTYFPYSLARALSGKGYTSLAFYRDEEHRPAYEALGFSLLIASAETDELTAQNSLTALLETAPFFAYYVWDSEECDAALAALTEGLTSLGLMDDTVFCILTGDSRENRAQLILQGEGLQGQSVSHPCSELDVIPTLLNLFGVDYDSRFLSGRDAFAPAGNADQATSLTPLVTLQGSAYSSWVTPAGNYIAADSLFWQRGDALPDAESISTYVNAVNRLVYDRYVFARRVMENNYFQLALGGK